MARRERIRSRGPEGAGGWLESACKLVLAVRAGVLLVTLVWLTGEEDRSLVAFALVVAARPRSCRCATGTASLRRSCAIPHTWRPS